VRKISRTGWFRCCLVRSRRTDFIISISKMLLSDEINRTVIIYYINLSRAHAPQWFMCFFSQIHHPNQTNIIRSDCLCKRILLVCNLLLYMLTVFFIISCILYNKCDRRWVVLLSSRVFTFKIIYHNIYRHP